MANVSEKHYRATLYCSGPDGDAACGPVRGDGVATDRPGEARVFDFGPDGYRCPICGRTDGFTVEANEELP